MNYDRERHNRGAHIPSPLERHIARQANRFTESDRREMRHAIAYELRNEEVPSIAFDFNRCTRGAYRVMGVSALELTEAEMDAVAAMVVAAIVAGGGQPPVLDVQRDEP